MPTTMKTKRFLALCLVAGVAAFGVGSAASWLPNRTATATGGDGAVAALPELVPAALDETAAASGAARTVHVAKYEVTIAEWDRCAARGGCSFTPRRRPWQNEDHPVTGVSWLDVQEYVRWLSRETGQQFRLPMEREWDYLARDVVEQEVAKLWDDPRLDWAADYLTFGKAREEGHRAGRPLRREPSRHP